MRVVGAPVNLTQFWVKRKVILAEPWKCHARARYLAQRATPGESALARGPQTGCGPRGGSRVRQRFCAHCETRQHNHEVSQPLQALALARTKADVSDIMQDLVLAKGDHREAFAAQLRDLARGFAESTTAEQRALMSATGASLLAEYHDAGDDEEGDEGEYPEEGTEAARRVQLPPRQQTAPQPQGSRRRRPTMGRPFGPFT